MGGEVSATRRSRRRDTQFRCKCGHRGWRALDVGLCCWCARKLRALAIERAGARVQAALRQGVLSRGACEVCGEESAHAHHDDYAFPLCVRWLCRSHHRQWHVENGYGANAYPGGECT